jgi:hypothetical protein
MLVRAEEIADVAAVRAVVASALARAVSDPVDARRPDEWRHDAGSL